MYFGINKIIYSLFVRNKSVLFSIEHRADMLCLRIFILLKIVHIAQTIVAFNSSDNFLFKQQNLAEKYGLVDKSSSECLKQNILLDKYENKKILFVRGNGVSFGIKYLLIKSIQRSNLGYNINLSSNKILQMDTIGINGPNYLIIFMDHFNDIGIHRLSNLKHISHEIHLVYLRKSISNQSVLQGTAHLHFKMFPDAEIGKIVFHIRKKFGNENFSWQMLKPSRKKHRGIKQLSECHFNRTGARQVRFKKKITPDPRTLNILTRENEPYTYFDNRIGFHKGIEIFLMKTIAARLGLRCKFILDTDNTGVGNISIIIGGYGNTSLVPSNFVSTQPYAQDDSTWCVARVKPLPVGWNLLRMFEDRRIVILNMLALSFSLLLVYYFSDKKYGGRVFCFHETFLFVIRLAMNMGYVSQAKKTFPRIMASLFMIACLFHYHMFTSCYTGIIVFRVYDRQMQTKQEIILNNYRLAGDIEVYGLIIKENKVYLLNVKFTILFNVHVHFRCHQNK